MLMFCPDALLHQLRQQKAESASAAAARATLDLTPELRLGSAAEAKRAAKKHDDD